MGNYVSDRVGNYVSGTPSNLGNFMSADSLGHVDRADPLDYVLVLLVGDLLRCTGAHF
jgi:hypothetical protein